LFGATNDLWRFAKVLKANPPVFAARGVRQAPQSSLFQLADPPQAVQLMEIAGSPILTRIMHGDLFGEMSLDDILQNHAIAAPTVSEPPASGMSAGKNTYTYDAHTYHTKVPPQGIAELLKHYLPDGGLVLDPFAGSGMTGVASRVLGLDCILNELSPAACFIANRFTQTIPSRAFQEAVMAVLEAVETIRHDVYTTICRECGRATEILYTVWSYHVLCSTCNHEFLLWDHCRAYGKRVRDHKILTEFPCPQCHTPLKKARLRRTFAEPVQIGYMCCGSRQQEVIHALNKEDLERIYRFQTAPPVVEGWYPTTHLPNGVNLRQPQHHGINHIDQFYTPRNLAAMSHLWQTIHRIADPQIAAHLAFVFTSLYQRVTRLSEFRFWGGSGNTARFNVPFIFNEANVFLTFARKARTIQDHLETTAQQYKGNCLVVEHTATNLSYIPSNSVDCIFTDPPFGASINYSEMNIVWESWLEKFTDIRDEAIINAVQGKDLAAYQSLMQSALNECYRVLRPGHWMLLVFMNSSKSVWEALHRTIISAGFTIRKVDIFDKQHGTFKQFVSENTAGCDLVLHCLKPIETLYMAQLPEFANTSVSVADFLETTSFETYQQHFLHVQRAVEVDTRRLYSEWLAWALTHNGTLIDFDQFRQLVQDWMIKHDQASGD
jgi:DNA modification methylase